MKSNRWQKIFLSVLLLVVVTVVYAVYLRKNLIISSDEARERASQPSSKFISWKGNTIHYTDEGQGPTVLMLHGFGGSYYNFHALAGMLKDSFRVIRLDLPGSGLSDFKHSGDEGIDYFVEFSDFFRVFLDSAGLDSFYVIGNSLGGTMAYSIAAEHPERVRKLMLLSSAGYDMGNVIKKGAGPLRWNWFRPVLQKGTPFIVVKEMVLYPFADRSKADPSEFKYDFVLTNREGNLSTWFDMATSGQYPDTSIIPKIKCPTMVIWGKEDIIIPVNHAFRFKRDIPHSRLKIYSPCGHMPQMELPEKVKEDFISFVKEN